MSIEAFLFVNLMMDLPLLAIVARSCGAFNARRVLGAGMTCAVYALLAARYPRPWASPAVQLALLMPIAMLVVGRKRLRAAPTAALLMTAGALLAGGGGALMRGAGSSPLRRAASACAALALLAALLTVRRQRRTTWQVDVCIHRNGKIARFPALIDTGNRLHEPVSGLPVLVAEAPLVRNVMPESGFRTVAFGALGGQGALECFRPDAVWIEDGKRRRPAPDVWVAIAPTRLPGATRALAPCEFSALP